MSVDVPKIVLIPHSKSHPFVQRECVLTQPQKVGRSVDKKRISQNNLIFDCRVLSRNHALIWFDKGKFYIQDTKSSNGTFVNECRLSPSAEESEPVELKSRDVVQFGVNVNVERRVTHGCIIATVKLFINDIEVPGPDPDIQEIMQVMQSALSREQDLETKMALMQEVLNEAQSLASESMISIVKEDELLSRLEMLENQLQVYLKNSPDDDIKRQLIKALEEKHKNDLTSKESLRNMLQEKAECVSKHNQLQRDYDKAEQECQRFRTLYDTLKHEYAAEVNKLNEQVKATERDMKATEDKLREEKQHHTTSTESLQAEVDFTKQQLSAVKSRLEQTQDELFELKVTAETNKQRMAALGIKVSEPLESSGVSEELSGGGRDGEGEGKGERGEEGEEGERGEEGGPGQSQPMLSLSLLPEEATLSPSYAQMQMMSPDKMFPVVEDQRSAEAGEAHTQEAKEEDTAAKEAGKSSEAQKTHGAQSSLLEQLSNLQDQVRAQTSVNQILQDNISVLQGQLKSCYTELQDKHHALLRLQKSQAITSAAAEVDDTQDGTEQLKLEDDLKRCHAKIDKLVSSNSTLELRLSHSKQEHEEEMEPHVEVLRARVVEEQEERKRVECELRDLQDLHKKVSEDGDKPHFLVRPGSPTAEEQKAKLFTMIALVSIGVALSVLVLNLT